MVLSTSSGESLACCADDTDPRSGINSCGASISPLSDSVARTTFQLVRFEARPGTLESTIRYEDDVRAQLPSQYYQISYTTTTLP